MSSSFWNAVNKVIKESDVIIQVVDARFPEATRNQEIEDKVRAKKKEIIYVQNKSDLVPLRGKKTLKVGYQVFVSASKNLGTTKLRRLIAQLRGDAKNITIGILGYPNTGKSSLINALKQTRSASTSSKPGHTKGIQKLRIGRGMYLLDSPGVYPYRESDETKLAMVNCLAHDIVKEPDLVVYELIESYGKEIAKYYKIKYCSDPEELLGQLTARLNLFKKGNVLDIERASRQIISDWQKGKIKK